MKSPKMNGKLILIIIVLLYMVAGYFGFTIVFPAYSSAQSQYAAAQSENATYRKIKDNVDNFLGNYQQQSSRVARANLALPNNPDMGNFVNNLSKLASDSGIELTDVMINSQQLGLISPPNAIQATEVSFVVTGDYPNFKAFITKLEHHLRVIDVATVSVDSRQAAGSNQAQLQYGLKIHTYYQKQ
jgi:Tfp pilus assembly protein PilO